MNAARAVLRELTLRRVVGAQLIVVIWMVLKYVNFRFFAARPLEPTFMLSGFVIDELTAMSLLVSIFVGREATLRGARPLLAYGLPLVLSALFTGYTQRFIRQLFGFRLLGQFDADSDFNKWFLMLYIALDTLIYGAFVMFVYVNRLHEAECVEKARRAALERTRLERELAHSQLAAAGARLDPVAILAELAHIKTLYEADSPAAEPALDALAQNLRLKLEAVRLA